jgi:hypothetical protein
MVPWCSKSSGSKRKRFSANLSVSSPAIWRMAGPEAGDRRDHGERALAARGFAVDLGDGPRFEPAADEIVERR